MSNTIILKNYNNNFEEFTAASVIKAGNLVQQIANGSIQNHALLGGSVLPMFAKEDSLQGKGIEDSYAIGDKVTVWIPIRGDLVNATLANNEVVVIGDFLVSNGDGTLKKLVVAAAADAEYANAIVGVATKAVDMSTATDPDFGHISVRIL